MGASQSVVVVGTETPSGFYVLKAGRYVSVCAKTLKLCYVSEDEMTPLHQEMISKGVLIQVQLYERVAGAVEAYQPSTKKFYKLLTAMALLNRNIEEYWANRMFGNLIAIMRPIKVATPAIDIYAVASQIIDAAIHTPAMSRDDLAKLAAPISDVAIRDQVIGALVTGLGELSTKIIRGGAPDQDEEPLPMVTGAGDEDKPNLDVVKNLYLEKFSKQRGEIIEHVLGLFSKMPYDAMKAAVASGTNEEKLRRLAAFLKSNSAKDPESITRVAVDALNKEFGVMVIDPSLPTNIKIGQLAELLNSMSSRVSADFFLMGIDINHDVRAMTKLLDALQIWYNAAEARLDQVEGATLLAPLKDIMDEFKRYLGMMNMALDQYFMPTLPGFLAQGEEAKARYRGDVQLSDRIMEILRGFVSTASQATALSVSLQKLGMNPDEFKLLKDKNEFWRRFAQLVTNEKLLASSQPKEFFDAAVFAVKSLGNKDELVAEIERQKTEKVGRGIDGGVDGGKRTTPEVLAIDRMKTVQGRTRIVLNTYGQMLQAGIRKVREGIDHLADVIGTEVPVGSLLDNFRDLLRQLADVKLEIPRIHLALLGYYKDAAAREMHDKVLGSLKQVAKYAEFVTEDAAYAKSKPYFFAIRDAINELVAAIDQASDSIRGVTGGEGGVEDKEGMEVFGGVAGGISEEWEPLTQIRDLVIRDKLKLIDSIEKADYMVRVSRLKSNLKKMTEDFPKNTVTYEERVLGPAVAARINNLEKARSYVLTQLGSGKEDPKIEVGKFNPTDLTDHIGAADLNAITPFGANVAAKYDFLHNARAAATPAEKEQKEVTEKFVKEYYGNIIGFWESAQAIELYLKYFTNAIISNPGEIQDIAFMIREVEVLTRMYDENSGDSIAKIFELNFPANKNLSNVLEPAAGGAAAIVPATIAGKHYLEWTNIGAFPFTQILRGRLDKMLKETYFGLGKYVALKNLLSFFIHFGSKIGGTELRRMAPRTPTEIYLGLMRYLATSSFAMGFRHGSAGAATQSRLTYNATTGQFAFEAAATPAAGVALAAGQATPANPIAVPAGGDNGTLFGCGATLRLSNSIFMRPSQQIIATTVAPAVNAFDTDTGLDLSVENQVFSAIIKSLGAKVLVLSGMHDLINRPHETHESRASVRVILGAADSFDALPKVEDAVTELYVRLPLLALFYKKHFSREASVSAPYMKDTAKIVLLPDLAGSVFSEFINLFFRKFRLDNLQFLTDNEMKALIPEINKIYHQLAGKYPTDTVRSILNEFVETMSRMVYIIGSGDENEYAKLFATQVGAPGLDGAKNEMFRGELDEPDILGDEGDEDSIRRPLPSDRERSLTADITKKEPDREFVVKGEHWNLVKKFRCMLDRELTKTSTTSLRGSIVATQIKLGQTAADNDRFFLVCRLLRGTGNATPIENLRKLIFVEIMGTSLGMLSSIYTITRLLQMVGYVTNPRKILEAIKGVGMNCANITDFIAQLAAVIAATLNVGPRAAGQVADAVAILQDTILPTVMGLHTTAAPAIRGRTMLNATTSIETEFALTINAAPNANLLRIAVGPAGAAVNMDIHLERAVTQNGDRAIIENCVHYPSALGLLLETIASVKSHTHEMVRVDISNKDLLVDCSLLQEYVKKFLGSLVSFVDTMRPHIDPTTMDLYTNKLHPGSLYWLQEQFVEKLCDGRVTETGGQKYAILSDLTAVISEGFKTLTSPITLNMQQAVVAPANILELPNKFYVDYGEVLANIIAHNQAAIMPPQDGVAAPPALNVADAGMYRAAKILSDPFDMLLVRGFAGEKTIDTRYLFSLSMTGDERVYRDINNSVLFSFNKLLAMYLRQLYDASTGKIFTGLIDTFAQGTFNNVILNPKNTYPDTLPAYYFKTDAASAVIPASLKNIVSVKDFRQTAAVSTAATALVRDNTYILYPRDQADGNVLRDISAEHARVTGTTARAGAAGWATNDYFQVNQFENRLLPDGNHVLFSSLGYILQNILTVTDDRTQLRVHLLESAADIPMYLREKYRAQIPFFRAAFDSLMHKCEFYRQIMEGMEANCFRTPTVEAGKYPVAQLGYTFNGTVSEKLLGILKSVTSGASAIVQDCSRALTDIGDQPKYFETSQDSINTYRAQNNHDPIMLLSPMLAILRGDGFDHLNPLLPPRFNLGDPSFKYQYAIRGLYHHMKGKQESAGPLQTNAALDSMVTQFNKYSHGGIKFDAQLAQSLAQLLERGFDFIHDIRRVKSFISIVHGRTFSSSERTDQVPLFMPLMRDANATAETMKNIAVHLLSDQRDVKEDMVPTPFGLSAPDAQSMVSIVEDRYRENAIKTVLNATISQPSEAPDMVMANIVDTNIMPFDLHVLARQMPLHFIWNYAFTFDAITGSMLYDKMTSPKEVMDAYFTGCRTDPNTGAIVSADTLPTIRTARDALFAMLADPYRTFSRAEKNLVDRMLVGATGVPEFARPKFLSDQIAGKILLGRLLAETQPEVGPPSTALGVPTYTFGHADWISDVVAEQNEYQKVLTEFARQYWNRYHTLLPSAAQGDALWSATAILAIARPLQAELDDDEFRDVSACRAAAASAAGGFAMPTTLALCRAAAAPGGGGNADVIRLATEFTRLKRTYSRSVAAVLLVTDEINRIAVHNHGNGIWKHTGHFTPNERAVWKDVITRWKFVPQTILTNAGVNTAVVAATAARQVAVANQLAQVRAYVLEIVAYAAEQAETAAGVAAGGAHAAPGAVSAAIRGDIAARNAVDVAVPALAPNIVTTALADAALVAAIAGIVPAPAIANFQAFNAAQFTAAVGALAPNYVTLNTAVNRIVAADLQVVADLAAVPHNITNLTAHLTALQYEVMSNVAAAHANARANFAAHAAIGGTVAAAYNAIDGTLQAIIAAVIPVLEVQINPAPIALANIATAHEITIAQTPHTLASADRLEFDPFTNEYGETYSRNWTAIPQAQTIHDMRMDTLLVRNLIHIGLVLEIVQMRLQKDMTYVTGHSVASSSGSLNSGIYKFFGFQTQPDPNPPRDERKFI